jgi:hypothetical protein
MTMKNYNDTIGNRYRNLPVCSAVPQPLRHRVPLPRQKSFLSISEEWHIMGNESTQQNRSFDAKMQISV